MISAADTPDVLVRSVAERLAERVGLDPASVSAEAVRRVLHRLLCTGLGPEEILAASACGDSDVHSAFVHAVCVGETYFFRHAEQLDQMRELVSARSLGRPLRVWSAGCSTGEEAYTVAWCLRSVCPHGVRVLGTDVVQGHVNAARRGIYGDWSLRGAGARTAPWLASVGDRFHVTDALRALVQFEVHNVLDPPPEDGFDVVLCRNVVVYFSAGAARRACSRLASALSPGGVLVLGPVDAIDRPPGLEPHGASWGSIFTKPTPSGDVDSPSGDDGTERPEAPRRKMTVPRSPRPPEPLSGRAHGGENRGSLGVGDSVRHHLDALIRVERGEDADAEAFLERARPSYVPGLLERALLRGRQGRSAAAERLMEEVLARTKGLPDEQILEGPEPLPVEFYRSTASTYLARRAGRRVR